MGRYLQNGNVLAARTFLTHFVSHYTAKHPDLISVKDSAISVGKPEDGVTDEITFTNDSILNFSQLAVRTCQRAQGDKNKAIREAWVRLCGTYQSKGGILAKPEMRRVSFDCGVFNARPVLPCIRIVFLTFSLPVSKVLTELAELYFAIPPPRNQQANPFGDMFSAMFGGAGAPAPPARRVIASGSNAPALD